MKILLIVLIFVFTGCSQSATVLMADGQTHEIEIVNADSQYLYGRSELDRREFKSAQTQNLIKIKKEDVVEVDHPGNVHLLVGGILASVGALNGVLAISLLAQNDDAFNHLFGLQILANAVVYLGVGVPLGIWGWTTWDDSKRLASSTEPFAPTTEPRILLVPTYDNKNAKMGLSLRLQY